MSLRVLTIQEMLAQKDGVQVVLAIDVEVDGGILACGDTIFRASRGWGDDCQSVAYEHQYGWDFFEEGEVAVVEVTKHPLIIKPSKEQTARPAEEIGNPKVGAASKKYSLRYMPLSANIEANRALENGAEKYGLCNWRDTNVKASVYIDAALRHIAQWQEGQEQASDSTVHNLGHAMASLAIIIDAQAQGVLIDDRPTASKDTDFLLLRGKFVDSGSQVGV